jgi:hypothetical protein
MGFNIMPTFKLYENDEELFQGNSFFEEFLDSTTIFEDTLDLSITRDDAKFFKQFNFYATLVRSSNARHLLSPIKEHKEEWRDVMQKGQLYNPEYSGQTEPLNPGQTEPVIPGQTEPLIPVKLSHSFRSN